MHSSSSGRPRGFTLVEILVVIGVIALLSAILLPVLGRARENAKRTACASNMKQLGMAFMQYTQDANDRLPIAVDGAFGATAQGQASSGWTRYTSFGTIGVPPVFEPENGSLFQYVKSNAVYICPSDMEGRTSKQSYAANSCVFEKRTGAPGECVPDATAGDCRVGKKLTRFRQPTEWMLLNEEGRDPANTASSTDDGYLNLKYTGDPDAYQNTFSKRHLDGSILTFMDGHSKWYPLEKISSDKYQIGGPRVTASLLDGCPTGVQ